MVKECVSWKIQSTIHLASETYQSLLSKNSFDLDPIEAHVQQLSLEISALDIAAQEDVKGELKTLDSILEKIGSSIGNLQNELAHKLSELNVHKRTFNAYAHVVNNNAVA